MSLGVIVRVLGGDLYASGIRANIPAPGHSATDRSVSLLLSEGRVIIHSFSGASWQEVRAHLLAHGLVDSEGRPADSGFVAGPPPVPSPSRLERRAAAQTLWDAATPLRSWSPAGRYCRSRAVPEAFDHPGAMRSHSAAPVSVYRPTSLVKPALVSAILATDGVLTAVELTYLTAAGALCPRLRTPRKTIGQLPAGSAVRLDQAAAELLVGEGVFTTLSAMARFGLPGWALLSTGNLRRWTPPEGVRRVLIAADRGKDGEASAEQLRDALARRGVAAEVRPPPQPFGDWNDWARAARDAERAGRREQGIGRARPGAG